MYEIYIYKKKSRVLQIENLNRWELFSSFQKNDRSLKQNYPTMKYHVERASTFQPTQGVQGVIDCSMMQSRLSMACQLELRLAKVFLFDSFSSLE